MAGTQGPGSERDEENFNNSRLLSYYCVVGTITAYYRHVYLVFHSSNGDVHRILCRLDSEQFTASSGPPVKCRISG